ncbi:MAG: hypothetical protein J3R72DRAFT_527194 [Linnemannia gamsii]|nr:MAG: hypothetical protein J3R72DRAFT_527194 [Linnemannia gamsii]
MYDHALDVPGDYSTAMEWYLNVAAKKYAPAQTSIGDLHANGQGVPEDNSRALEWYFKASSQEFPAAEFNIAGIFEEGQGVPRTNWPLWNGSTGRPSMERTMAGPPVPRSIFVSGDLAYPRNRQWHTSGSSWQVNKDLSLHKLRLVFSKASLKVEISPSSDASRRFSGNALKQRQMSLTKATIEGRSNAQRELGFMYHEGHGILRDYQVAFEWFSKAAEQDHGLTQGDIGNKYIFVRGVPQDFTKAMENLLKSANQGGPSAQYDMAPCSSKAMVSTKTFLSHSNDSSNPQNEAMHSRRRRKHFSVTATLPGATHCGLMDDKICRALEISSTTSITPRLPTLHQLQDAMAAINNKLAIQAMVPAGLEISLAKAMEARNLTFPAQGNGTAGRPTRTIHKDNTTPPRCTNMALVVPQDFSLAIHWYLKAESKGHILAQACIGDIYANGVLIGGVAKDYSEAMNWYLKAEQAWRRKQLSRLGSLCQGFTFLNGVGVPKDLTKAFELMLKAARKGLIPTYKDIGAMYYHGQGTPQDYEQARYWFLKNARLGYPNSQYYLGIMYRQGRGVSTDDKIVFECFLKSVKQGVVFAQREVGNIPAQVDLGCMYKIGLSTSQYDIKAVEWFHKSAEQGDASVQLELGYKTHQKAELMMTEDRNLDKAAALYVKSASLLIQAQLSHEQMMLHRYPSDLRIALEESMKGWSKAKDIAVSVSKFCSDEYEGLHGLACWLESLVLSRCHSVAVTLLNHVMKVYYEFPDAPLPQYEEHESPTAVAAASNLQMIIPEPLARSLQTIVEDLMASQKAMDKTRTHLSAQVVKDVFPLTFSTSCLDLSTTASFQTTGTLVCERGIGEVDGVFKMVDCPRVAPKMSWPLTSGMSLRAATTFVDAAASEYCEKKGYPQQNEDFVQ